MASMTFDTISEFQAIRGSHFDCEKHILVICGATVNPSEIDVHFQGLVVHWGQMKKSMNLRGTL
jgi:hypothetical protein